MTDDLRLQYAHNIQIAGGSPVTELLKHSQEDGIISFAGGFPAPELFPAERFKEASDFVLSHQNQKALQYGSTIGYEPLREFLVQKMAEYGIQACLENILITSGSQQSLDLIGRIFLNQRDRILSEKPTFLGALQAWRAFQVDYVTLPLDEDGFIPQQLDASLKLKPKFFYIIPNFQNPAGVTLSLRRRQLLFSTLGRNPLPIVEDDPYGELRFEGDHLPPLIALDAQDSRRQSSSTSGRLLENGRVIYLGTFSKILAPGLRLGWMVGPAEFIQDAALVKQGVDLQSSSFVQMVTYQVVKDGFLSRHIQQVKAVYRQRRDFMMDAMRRQLPPGIQWTHPQGGFFLWVVLPEGLDATDLLREALKNKVVYVPGSAFFPDGSGQNTFRLSFSNAQPEQIEQGIKRLGETLSRALELTLKT